MYQTPLRITREYAEELLSRCKQVLEDHSLAETLLPTMPGFFFGSTEYDEYYFENVQEVYDYVENVLLPAFDDLIDGESIYFETWY